MNVQLRKRLGESKERERESEREREDEEKELGNCVVYLREREIVCQHENLCVYASDCGLVREFAF